MQANPEYPNQQEGDFSSYYDPNTSDIPWKLDENCSSCGRIHSAIDPMHSSYMALYCPYRHKRIHYRACSGFCRGAILASHKMDCDRYQGDGK